MKKYPRDVRFRFPRLFKGFIALEIIVAAGSYLVWHRLNTSRNFRKLMHEEFPSVLEGYYSLGEKFDSTNNIRSSDLHFWKLEKQNSV